MVSIGAKSGIQRGFITAYGFEITKAELDHYSGCDFLIRSVDENGAFSDTGDSGKLIALQREDNKLYPIALNYAGTWSQFEWQNLASVTKWTKGIALSAVLKYLNCTLYKG